MKETLQLPLIFKQEDGIYIISCNTFKTCHSHGKTIHDTNENIKEVISMCMEEEEYNLR